MKKFRFDYNYRMFLPVALFAFIASIILCTSIINETIRTDTVLFAFIIIGISILYLIYGYGYGIKIDYDKELIKIRTAMYNETIKFEDISHIYYYEAIKKKGNKTNNAIDYYIRKRNFHSANYVFNNGKVFVIVICYKSGFKKKVEFSWMYKEKSQSKVMLIEKKLQTLINEFNNVITTQNIK